MKAMIYLCLEKDPQAMIYSIMMINIRGSCFAASVLREIIKSVTLMADKVGPVQYFQTPSHSERGLCGFCGYSQWHRHRGSFQLS